MAVSFVLKLLMAMFLFVQLTVSNPVITAATPSTLPCLTPTCIHQASLLLSRMNTSVDPCDDFYEFTCGRYIAETELPEDKLQIDPLSSISSEVNNQVRKMIIEKGRPDELRPFTLLRKFYKSCMNTNAIDEKNLDQIKAIFGSLGGFPALEGDKWTEINWIELIRKLRQHGYQNKQIITVDVDINPKNSKEYVVSVDQALNEEVSDDKLKDGLKDPQVKSYADLLIDLVVLLGVDKEFATKEVHDVIAFRGKIAEISAQKKEHVALIIAANDSTIAEIQKTYPKIDWLDLINAVFALPDRTITAQEKVFLVPPEYVKKLDTLLSETPKRVQVNHVMLQILREVVRFLPKSFRDREQKFLAEMFGITKASARWEICIAKATEYFNLAVDALYVRKFVDVQAKTDVSEMVSNIRTAFINILKDVEWMDEDTKQQAIQKAEAITPFIAYPDEIRDDKKLEDYYSQLKFDSDNILLMISEAAKFKRDKDMSFYGEPVVKNHWTKRLAAITGNAIYDPQGNSIQIPSGIMQSDFYNKNRPQYMNYGSLGMIIGHEITHGFDDAGKAFDKSGNSANWWKPSTNDAYNEKAKCFIEQYSSITAPEVGMNLNGKTTIGENIADNGGVKEAYLAYLEWVKQNKEEASLPGLNYTYKQLFWISVGNAWCAKSRPELVKQLILTDEHLPNRYRIFGSLNNMQHFADDFSCPAGSKMNSVSKCQIW